jgi:hypothetical protein
VGLFLGFDLVCELLLFLVGSVLGSEREGSLFDFLGDTGGDVVVFDPRVFGAFLEEVFFVDPP